MSEHDALYQEFILVTTRIAELEKVLAHLREEARTLLPQVASTLGLTVRDRRKRSKPQDEDTDIAVAVEALVAARERQANPDAE